MISSTPIRRASACGVPGLVGRQEELDQPPRRVAVGRVGNVEVPVDRAALGVQRRLVRPPHLAAVRAPEDAVGVALQPADEAVMPGLGLLVQCVAGS